MRISIILALMCILAACSSKKESLSASRDATIITPPPEWVANKPHSSSYYIGIGSCSKYAQPYDFQTIAKKNALNDLASEISVRVQGQTFLNSLEVNNSFSEEFVSNVSTSTDERIEGFEVVGSWEDKNEYWVFYRLDKSSYQARKLAKKSAALNVANDYYQKALTAEGAANVSVAFDLYMRALFALKEYWNEPNEMLTEKGLVFLDNEIFSSVQSMCGGIRIKTDVVKIRLHSVNNYEQTIQIKAIYNDKPVRGISLNYSYNQIGDDVVKSILTAEGGVAYVMVNGVDYSSPSNALQVELDVRKLIVADLDQKVQEALIKSFKSDKQIIPIESVLPTFYIASFESVYGRTASGKVLQSAMTAALVAKGMHIAGSPGDADYTVTITSDTKEGGGANGFVVSYLEMNVVARNTENQEVVYNETLSSIKGLQLNRDAASIEAYKKGKEKIDQQVVSKLIQTIM